MDNGTVTGHEVEDPHPEVEAEAELHELTARIHDLTFERIITVRRRNALLVTMYRQGYSIDKLAELSDMHVDDVCELVHFGRGTTPR